MRKIGITRYREFDLLMYNNGRSCQDDFVLEEIVEKQMAKTRNKKERHMKNVGK